MFSCGFLGIAAQMNEYYVCIGTFNHTHTHTHSYQYMIDLRWTRSACNMLNWSEMLCLRAHLWSFTCERSAGNFLLTNFINECGRTWCTMNGRSAQVYFSTDARTIGYGTMTETKTTIVQHVGKGYSQQQFTKCETIHWRENLYILQM